MSSRVTGFLGVSLLALLLAAAARADEPKVYRWVGPDGRVYTSNAPPKDGKGLIDGKPAPPAARAPEPGDVSPADGETCSHFAGYVSRWRDAQRSIESWEATVDRIQSRTDDFVRRDDSAYENSLDRANERLDLARESASRIESEGRAAGMPQSCLTE